MQQAHEQEEGEPSADVSLKLAGQELRLRNVKSFNTLVSLIGAIAAAFAVYLLTQHNIEAKEAGVNFVTALKEQTKAITEQTAVQREGNCLIVIKDTEQCRRIAGIPR